MKAPSLWIVAVPGGRQYEVMAWTIEQALEFVAAQLGRRLRLRANNVGEHGEIWRVGAENDVIVAPMVYPAEAA